MDKLSDLFEKSWRRRAPRTPRDSPDADLSETAGDDTTTSAATPTPPTRRGRHPHRGPNGPAPVSGPSGNGTGSRTPVTMAYDMANGTDAKDAQAKSSGLKVDFDRQDVEFWFEQLEMHMFGCGLAAQWTNRMVLHKMLPPDIVSEIKDLLRKNQASAGETPYKDIKDSLLETFGQKRADAFAQADALVMTGKPSQLLHKLINILCKHHPDLVGCCAEGTITGMWRKKLPTEVRQRIAGCSLVGKDSMKPLLQTEDAVYETLKGPTIAVSAVAPYNPALDALADQPALQQPVAAYRGHQPQRGTGRKRGQSNNRGARAAGASGGRQNQQKSKDRGTPHPDGPPSTACNLHWKYGRSAFKCWKPDTCPWANLIDKN